MVTPDERDDGDGGDTGEGCGAGHGGAGGGAGLGRGGGGGAFIAEHRIQLVTGPIVGRDVRTVTLGYNYVVSSTCDNV